MCLIAPRLDASPWQDSYDASRLLLPRLFRHLPVRGAPVLAAPHRDLLLLTGSEDPEGQEALFQQLLKESKFPYALTPKPLVMLDDRWQDYPPQLQSWQALIQDFEVCLYNEQSEYLDKNLSEDPASPSIMTISRGASRCFVTTWAFECASLLAPADWVMVQVSSDPEEPYRFYAWQPFRQAFDDYLREESGMYPGRLRTLGFPSRAQLDATPWAAIEQLMPS